MNHDRGVDSNVQAIVEGIREIATAARVIAEEATKRAQIRAKLETDLERIRSSRAIMTAYLERTFDERRHNFEGLFARLDASLSEGNMEAVSLTLNGIVKLADSSPFRALKDAKATREILESGDEDWEF